MSEASNTAKPGSAPDPIGDMQRMFEKIRKTPPPPPPHDCRFDGHVAQFMSRRCVYCLQVIRELSVDEKHVQLGEFWA